MDLFHHLIEEFQLPLKNPVLVFTLILLIILIAPLVFRKFKAPGIVGLIISGVIIGPHGLNLLEENSAVTLFSTIGLLYLMFQAGLELDMGEFIRNRHRSIVFGILTFMIPMTIGFVVCYYLLNYNIATSLLTTSMFATHTLVTYPIINKYGLSKDQAIAITIGGTIITDTAVLLLLALIEGATQRGLSGHFFLKLSLSLIVFSIIIFYLIPRLAKWFFSRLESERTSHYVFVLAIVFFAAFLSEIAGVEPIIGAFMAGLALNRLIPHTSSLMNRLDFVGNAIFIPFFLISVGMLVDVDIILKHPRAWLVASVLTTIALSTKWIAAWITQKLYHYSKNQRQVIFGLSSSRAAATLAVITAGYHMGIVNENILNGTIILILFTCLIAAVITERSASKLVLEENLPKQKTGKDGNEETILIPVANFNNLEHLIDLTGLLKEKIASAPVHLLSVVKNDHKAELNMVKTKRKLEQSVRYASAADMEVKSNVTIDVNVAHAIIRMTKELSANTIVMGWPSKTTLLDRFFGHKTDNIIENFDNNIIMCNLKRPFNTHKKIRLVCPPFAEAGKGFTYWQKKVFTLASHLKLPITFYCTSNTWYSIEEYITNNKIKVTSKFHEINDLHDFMNYAHHIEEDEILILVSARKGSVYYQNEIDFIHKKLNVQLENTSTILIYPMRKKKYIYN